MDRKLYNYYFSTSSNLILMKTRFSIISITVLTFFLFSFGLCDKVADSVVVTFDPANKLFPTVAFTFSSAPVTGTQTHTGSYTVYQIDSTIQSLTSNLGTKRYFKDLLSVNVTKLTLTITSGDADFSVIGHAKCVAHFSNINSSYSAPDLNLMDQDFGDKYAGQKTITINIPVSLTKRINALQASDPTQAAVSYSLTVSTVKPVTTAVTIQAALSGSAEVQ